MEVIKTIPSMRDLEIQKEWLYEWKAELKRRAELIQKLKNNLK